MLTHMCAVNFDHCSTLLHFSVFPLLIGDVSLHPMPLITFNFTAAFGEFYTPGFPLPYNSDSEVKWHIQCSQTSYALLLLFDVDLRIGDKLVTEDKVIVGRWPFLYAYRIKHKGDTYMHLFLNSSETSSQSKGIRGAYVCVGELEQGCKHWTSVC